MVVRTEKRFAGWLAAMAIILLPVLVARSAEPAATKGDKSARQAHIASPLAFTPGSTGSTPYITGGDDGIPASVSGSGVYLLNDHVDFERDDFLAKKPPQAFLRSLLLPGWGQRWGERPVRGAVYTAVDAGLLTGLLISMQSNVSLTGAYETFARQHAGVVGDKSHDFYVDIGYYDSVEEYNDAKRMMRDYDAQYHGDDFSWTWDSDENRNEFRTLRIHADRDRNRTYYFLGGMILNRIVSAIDAAQGLKRKQKALGKDGGFSFGVDPQTMMPALIWTGNIGGK